MGDGGASVRGPALAEVLAEAAARAGGGRADRAVERPVPFTDNLGLLLRSSLETGRLNATGLDVLRRVAVRHVRNLIELEEREGGSAPPDRPIVVTGLPRTGTTLLHNLLALDPAHRPLRFWEALRPGAVDDPEAGIAAAERWLDAFYRLVPTFRRIHASAATGPEECDALLQNTFASQHFDDMFDAEEYSAWLATAPLAREYAHYARQLRSLPAPDGARWALKSPSHLGHLDALATALPGCTVIVCHRDPRQAVASYASLVRTLRQAYSESVSAERVGRQALARASTAMGRAMGVRRGAGAPPFVDVRYDDLVADPVREMHAVYEQLGGTMPAGVAAAVEAWCAANPADRHGAHRYDLEQFGLTAPTVDRAFEPYLDGLASAGH